LDLVGRQNFCGGHHVFVGTRYLPQVPLRPNHAFRLEDFHPCDLGVVGVDRGLDANPLEHLELMQRHP